ncbi:MAG TPA: DedA family protein, partial [Cyanobacteria bacterium UBA9226]|nr:DedA family protein [Cyanobacteria bacterium UBA9226]
MSFEFISLETIQEIARQYGYWAVFLGILLENLGLPLPGETVTLVGGFLAGSGELNFWWVFASAAGGAILGGICGYWIGRYGGLPLLLKVGKFFGINEEKLQKVQAQFGQNASKAVFIGRFIALLRVVASPLAGIAKMPFLKFMIYNVTGALAWALVMVSLSCLAGNLIPLEELLA